MDCDLIFAVLVSQTSCFGAQLLVDELQLTNNLEISGRAPGNDILPSSDLTDKGCIRISVMFRLRPVLCCKDSGWMEWVVAA